MISHQSPVQTEKPLSQGIMLETRYPVSVLIHLPSGWFSQLETDDRFYLSDSQINTVHLNLYCPPLFRRKGRGHSIQHFVVQKFHTSVVQSPSKL